VDVVYSKRGAERATGIAGGRLNPDAFEPAIAQYFAIRDAIEGDAAGKTQILHAGFCGQAAGEPQEGVL
jgi:hypothetical protein